MPQNIQGLQLYEPLGAGSFGKVYRGKWRGFQVAVKVQRHMSDAGTEKIRREAELSLKMKHPNVVQTYYHSIVHRDHVEVDRLLHGSQQDSRRLFIESSSTIETSLAKDGETFFTPYTVEGARDTDASRRPQTDAIAASALSDMVTPAGSTAQLHHRSDLDTVYDSAVHTASRYLTFLPGIENHSSTVWETPEKRTSPQPASVEGDVDHVGVGFDSWGEDTMAQLKTSMSQDPQATKGSGGGSSV